MTTFSGTTTARAYSALIFHTLHAMLRSAPQGEAQTLTIQTGMTVEAKLDAKYNTRYTVRKDGKAYRGISHLIMMLEAAWEADKLDQQLNAEVARRADALREARNKASFEGVSDDLAGRLEDVATIELVAGIARLFKGWTVTKLGAINAMQAAGLQLADAQAEADHWEAARDDAQKGEFAVDLTRGLEVVGTVRVRAHNSVEAATLAEKAWGGGAMAVCAKLCAPEAVVMPPVPAFPTAKPLILFRWSDSTRAQSDDRTIAARIIKAHRKGQRAGEKAFVRYDRTSHRIEVGHALAGVYGIFTRL